MSSSQVCQRIQADLGDVKRDLAEGRHDLAAKIDAATARMGAFEDYFTYTMGVTQQNKRTSIASERKLQQ
jgi:hypothetical protein